MSEEESEASKSIEELEKEVEELEAVEIVEEKPKKKEAHIPSEGVEKRFKLLSIFVGFIILVIYQLALPLILKVMGSVELSTLLQLILASQVIIPNIAVAFITGSDIFLGVSGSLIDAAYSHYTETSNLLSNLINMDGYVGLLVVAVIPFILAGFVAGFINHDPGYGFVAGFLIWILALFVGIIVAAFGSLGVSIVYATLQSISCGWLSALFLAIFGALGGARK
ncbi:MAG: hypothetical protein QXH55_02800 [Candidatus Korarchaeota archaeon]|nr:hypothetical protein [Thermoproteota archaeon]MCR8463059.1 hypothetical protein [Thermoproteota archaeon]MCR8470637.1 hypothetical protein [Thermoproteota archaeon]MCR8471605.1 hypothetical protein [Thermoproteota archaeon]MCR8473041.1 hypothetical protein [Thermoproteota archaeon]